MIVSTITGSSIQPKNMGFKGIYRTNIDYTESQNRIMDDITQKIQSVDTSNNKQQTFEQILKEKGFDVYLADSFIKEDAIDVYLAQKTNRKMISVGTYENSEFNSKDIEESIVENKRIERFLLGFVAAVAMVGLLLLGAKATSYSKSQNVETQKVLVQDSIKTAKDTFKKFLKFN